MNNLSHYDLEQAVKAAMSDAGLIISKPLIMDGLLHREHIDGHRSGSKNAAYIVHPEPPQNAWFMDYKTGLSGKWTLSGKREPMNTAMREQIAIERQRRQLEQQDRHHDAADKARFIWHSAKPITEQSQHPYLVKKRVQPYGVRLYKDALIIPIYDEHRQWVNLQFIDATGLKRFLSGGKKKGCFSAISKPDRGGIIQICEGWATGASLHEATGHFTVVALDAGNLKPVAYVFRRLYPALPIIICGDNDESGIGQKAARDTAIAVGGRCVLPEIEGQDWNDALSTEAGQ